MKLTLKNILPLIKISPSGIKKFIWFITFNAFFVILILILLNFIFGIFLFYKYVYVPKQEKPSVNKSYFQFKDDIYQNVLKEWEARNQKIIEFSEKNYKSPF